MALPIYRRAKAALGSIERMRSRVARISAAKRADYLPFTLFTGLTNITSDVQFCCISEAGMPTESGCFRLDPRLGE